MLFWSEEKQCLPFASVFVVVPPGEGYPHTGSASLPPSSAGEADAVENRLAALLLKTEPQFTLPSNSDEDGAVKLGVVLGNVETPDGESLEVETGGSPADNSGPPPMPPTPEAVKELGLSWCTQEEINMAEVCQAQLKYVAHDVHTFIGKLLAAFSLQFSLVSLVSSILGLGCMLKLSV